MSIIYEDEMVIGCMDIQPVNQGDALVFSRVHVPQLTDLRPNIGAHMFEVAMNFSEAMRASGLRCEGINLLLADGEAAGQEISHVYLHVIPRFGGGEVSGSGSMRITSTYLKDRSWKRQPIR